MQRLLCKRRKSEHDDGEEARNMERLKQSRTLEDLVSEMEAICEKRERLEEEQQEQRERRERLMVEHDAEEGETLWWERKLRKWNAEAVVCEHVAYPVYDVVSWAPILKDTGFVVLDLDLTPSVLAELEDQYSSDLELLGIDRMKLDSFGSFVWKRSQRLQSGMQYSKFRWSVARYARPAFQALFQHERGGECPALLLPIVNSRNVRGCASRNPMVVPKVASEPELLNPNVGRGRDGSTTYNSFLNIKPSNENTDGFFCVPESHKIFDQLSEEMDRINRQRLRFDEVKEFRHLHIEHSTLDQAIKQAGGKWLRLCPKPGQLVLWNSALITSTGGPLRLNNRNNDPLLRLVGHFSCEPWFNSPRIDTTGVLRAVYDKMRREYGVFKLSGWNTRSAAMSLYESMEKGLSDFLTEDANPLLPGVNIKIDRDFDLHFNSSGVAFLVNGDRVQVVPKASVVCVNAC